jgi:SNF2 family DNA or RNA helicase
MEMINRKDNLLSFDMRMGKTLVSSTLTVLDKISVTLVVCPGVTKFTAWHDDLIGWGFDKNTFTVYDSKKKYSKKAFNEKFIVINYELLGKHLEEIKKRNVGHIIFDECHRGKSTNTATAKNMQAVVKAFPNARITLLSGTPIANRVDDMYAYFKLIDHPLGANRAHFLRTYGVMYNSRGGEKVKKAKNHEDLRVKLSNFMIRRTQQECFDIMPKQQIRHVVSKDDFEEQYDRMIEELSLQRNHAALSGHIMAINNLTSLIKVPTAMDIIHEAHEYGKKVVVFCSFTAPLDEMERVLTENNMGFVRIDGSVDMASRRDIIKRFWDDPECNVFLGNMKAAGEGIDLSCASEIIFLNYAFTPKDMEQPAERCTSMANPKINTIHYLVCENSIDEVLYDIIVDKKMDIDAIVDQGKGTSSVSAITGEVFRRLTGNSFEVKKKEDEPIINE